MRTLTKRKITAALRSAAFAPLKPGPMKVIVDVGDFNYYIKRSQELLSLVEDSPTTEQRNSYLTTVLSLIAVAKVLNKE